MPASRSIERRAGRRLVLAGLAAGVVASDASGLRAQTWPDRPIRLVVPFPPGGAPDIMGRALSDRLQALLGQPVVVDNKPGAAGGLGADIVAKAPADGYTVLLGSISTHAINASLYPNLPYNHIKDFAALALLGSVPNVLSVTNAFPARTVAELVAYAKTNPGKVNFGSAGSGSTLHMSGELFKIAAGIDIQHVPYRGSAPAVADLISGQIQMMFDNAPSAIPQVRGGRIRALAQTGASRSSLLPDVPTMVESGFADFVVTGWAGLFAPAATPATILDRLHAALIEALGSADVKARLEPLAVDLQPMSRAAFAAFVEAETRRWGELVRRANIKVEG